MENNNIKTSKNKDNSSLNLEDVFFHGIVNFEKDNKKGSLKKFALICKKGAILSRKKIKNSNDEGLKKFKEKDFCYANWNGENYVCVASMFYDFLGEKKISYAFTDFVRLAPPKGIALIFDNSIKKDFENVPAYEKISGEFRIKNSLSLDHLIGVGINVQYFDKWIEFVKTFEVNRRESFVKSFYDEMQIFEIEKILRHYGYSVPIYNLDDGKVIPSFDELLNIVRVENKENSLKNF